MRMQGSESCLRVGLLICETFFREGEAPAEPSAADMRDTRLGRSLALPNCAT